MKVNILGTKYRIEKRRRIDDIYLKEADGYCDKTIKLIVVTEKDVDSQISDYEMYQKKCIRHEIVHAFLFESGLQEDFEHPHFGHDETYGDWIANQSPKLFKAFKEANAI